MHSLFFNGKRIHFICNKINLGKIRTFEQFKQLYSIRPTTNQNKPCLQLYLNNVKTEFCFNYKDTNFSDLHLDLILVKIFAIFHYYRIHSTFEKILKQLQDIAHSSSDITNMIIVFSNPIIIQPPEPLLNQFTNLMHFFKSKNVIFLTPLTPPEQKLEVELPLMPLQQKQFIQSFIYIPPNVLHFLKT